MSPIRVRWVCALFVSSLPKPCLLMYQTFKFEATKDTPKITNLFKLFLVIRGHFR